MVREFSSGLANLDCSLNFLKFWNVNKLVYSDDFFVNISDDISALQNCGFLGEVIPSNPRFGTSRTSTIQCFSNVGLQFCTNTDIFVVEKKKIVTSTMDYKSPL